MTLEHTDYVAITDEIAPETGARAAFRLAGRE